MELKRRAIRRRLFRKLSNSFHSWREQGQPEQTSVASEKFQTEKNGRIGHVSKNYVQINRLSNEATHAPQMSTEDIENLTARVFLALDYLMNERKVDSESREFWRVKGVLASQRSIGAIT